jgi:hypothetical protein
MVDARVHGAGEKRQHHGVVHETMSGVDWIPGIFRRSGTGQGAQIKVLHGEMGEVSQQLEAFSDLKVGQSQFPTFLK